MTLLDQRRGTSMWLLRALIVLLLCTAAPAQSIPHTKTATLSGESITLPDTLAGRCGVLVLGFSQGAKDPVAAWGKRLFADFHDTTDVAFWEAGSFGSVPRIVRGLVLNRVKDSMPQPAQAHFLALTEDEAAWKSIAHYDKAHPDDAYVLLLDETGNVRALVQGKVTDAAYAGLQQQIENLRKPPSTR